jgi:aminopeptidase N
MPRGFIVAALAFACAALPLGALASPFAAVDAAHGVLSKNVVPSLYVIDVAPNAKTGKIVGHVRITIAVRAAAPAIVINALQTTFGKVTLDGVAGTATVDAKNETATLRFPSPVAAGTHMLDIAYVATIQTTAQGLFKQDYSDATGKPAYMFGTQLEATDARRMFPSFDEPAFKARFVLSAVVPKDWTAVSNTPVVSTKPVGADLKRVQFAPTPVMSTYLVVFTAGDFEAMHDSADGIALSVYATRGKQSEEAYALEVMKQLMPYYDNYYGVKFPIAKLDTIAIPGGFLGAMENWGGITYNESTVLFDPKIQTQASQEQTYSIIAHEESHQWNGDLTTMPWWDDLWLAEGFATWMAVKAPDHFHPEWNAWLAADTAANGSMDNDSMITTHPVYVPVHNNTEIAAVFDEISYTKAGSVLRMLETYVGPDTFQKALQAYFRSHQYTSANAPDLWKALSTASGQDIAPIAQSWIYAPGFPLVTATATCSNGKRSVALAQQRYMFDTTANAGNTLWQIPLNAKMDARANTGTPVLFSQKAQTIDAGACDAPLVLNGDDVGFFRVAYDPATQAVQQSNFVALSAGDRMGLLDDSWAFVSSGRAKIDEYLAYVEADGKDTEPQIINVVLGNFAQLLSYEKDKPGEAALKTYIAARLRPMVAKFGGWDGTGMSDDQLSTRNRVLTMLAACGDAATIAEAKTRFAQLVANPNAFTPRNKAVVINIAGYAADAAIYKQIFAMALGTTNPTEQQNYFFAMFGAQDKDLAQQNLAITLHLPPQFAPYAPFIVAAVAQQHPQEAWAFLNANVDKLFGSVSSFEKVAFVSGVAGAFWNGVPADQIEAFMQKNLGADGAKEIAKAMAGVRANQALQARLVPEIDAYVATLPGAAATGAKSR